MPANLNTILPIAHDPSKPLPLDPIVLLLKEFVAVNAKPKEPTALDEAVKTAIAYKIPELEQLGINTADDFLDYANRLLRWIPHENFEAKDIYWTLFAFAFILDQPSLLKYQTPIQAESVGKPLTWLSAWMVCYAQRIGSHMDSPESLTTTSFQTFMNSPKFNIHECQLPIGGFKSFNELFTRHLLPGRRPISGPSDDNVIVFPADAKFDGVWNIGEDSHVNIKGINWPIAGLLDGSKYENEFKGGIWTHSFLISTIIIVNMPQ